MKFKELATELILLKMKRKKKKKDNSNIFRSLFYVFSSSGFWIRFLEKRFSFVCFVCLFEVTWPVWDFTVCRERVKKFTWGSTVMCSESCCLLTGSFSRQALHTPVVCQTCGPRAHSLELECNWTPLCLWTFCANCFSLQAKDRMKA